MTKLVYSFAEGDGKNKKLLGGKGANLCEMTQIGINVPPGFVITTEACLEYLDGNRLPEKLMEEVRAQLAALEEATGKTFGKGPDPLLVSVRSGSALSMPGMLCSFVACNWILGWFCKLVIDCPMTSGSFSSSSS